MADDNFFNGTSNGAVPREPWPEEPPPADSEAEYGDPRVVPIRDGITPPTHGNAISATPLSTRDLSNIAPRRWLYGYELIRGFVSILASPGGVGKTAYTIPVGLSVARKQSFLCDNPDRPPRHAKVHVGGPVWFWNLEDPMEEVDRRIQAALIHNCLEFHEVSDRVFTDSGRDNPLCIASRDRQGALVLSPVIDPLVEELKRRGIVLLVIDPFVQSHQAEENDNNEMNKVVAAWSQVAHRADCAVWLIHHFRKGGAGGDPDSIRGAVAIIGAVRSAWTVSGMTSEEANKLGVPDDQRRFYFRHDNAKQNMAPPVSTAKWFRLVDVPLHNETEEYPDGDHVQAVEAWTPPSPWDGLPWSDVEQILMLIDQGPSPGEYYALSKQSRDRWAGHVISRISGKTDGQASAILKTWKESGVIEDGEYSSPRQKGGMTGCVRVVQAKFAEMKRSAATPRSDVE